MTDMRNNKSQMAETETNNTKTLKEIFSEEIRAELASGRTKKPTFEEFKEMVEKEKSKRRKKYTAIAACFVTALVVGFFAFDYMACDVGADKNPKEIIQTEDGVIIEDGGWGSSTGEDNVWETEDWNDIVEAKALFPELLIPQYIPQGYVLKKLVIEKIVEEDYIYKYAFEKKETGEIIEIEQVLIQGGEVTTDITEFTKEVPTSKGNLFVDEKTKIATMQMDDGSIVSIFSSENEAEILKMVEKME